MRGVYGTLRFPSGKFRRNYPNHWMISRATLVRGTKNRNGKHTGRRQRGEETQKKEGVDFVQQFDWTVQVSFFVRQRIAYLNLLKMLMDYKAYKVKLTEPHFSLLQTVKKYYGADLKYRTYHHSNRSSRYDKTVSGYIGEWFGKVKLLVNAHYFIPKDPISISECLATDKLACVTNHIHEIAAMWVLSCTVHEKLANALKSRM